MSAKNFVFTHLKYQRRIPLNEKSEKVYKRFLKLILKGNKTVVAINTFQVKKKTTFHDSKLWKSWRISFRFCFYMLMILTQQNVINRVFETSTKLFKSYTAWCGWFPIKQLFCSPFPRKIHLPYYLFNRENQRECQQLFRIARNVKRFLENLPMVHEFCVERKKLRIH